MEESYLLQLISQQQRQAINQNAALLKTEERNYGPCTPHIHIQTAGERKGHHFEIALPICSPLENKETTLPQSLIDLGEGQLTNSCPWKTCCLTQGIKEQRKRLEKYCESYRLGVQANETKYSILRLYMLSSFNTLAHHPGSRSIPDTGSI